jgi:hypothetical protein
MIQWPTVGVEIRMSDSCVANDPGAEAKDRRFVGAWGGQSGDRGAHIVDGERDIVALVGEADRDTGPRRGMLPRVDD